MSAAEPQSAKTIFITGAASGIGRATAVRFAREGWLVGVSDIDERGLGETAAMLEAAGGKAWPCSLDVRRREEWDRALEGFGAASGGRLDVLFNNAGVARGGRFEDNSADDIERVVAINLAGVIHGCHAALPLLKETARRRGRAAIVNVASVAGLVAAPMMAVYSATKFGVRGLTESLAVELEPDGVAVSSLMPWFADTGIIAQPPAGSNQLIREALTERGVRILPVETVAEKAWEAAHSGALHNTVGKEADRARLFAQWAPGLVRRRLRRDYARLKAEGPKD